MRRLLQTRLLWTNKSKSDISAPLLRQKKLFEGDHEAGAALLKILYLLAWQMAKERQEIIGTPKGTNYLLRQPPGKLNPMTQLSGSKYFSVESNCDTTEKSSIVDIAIDPDQRCFSR